MKHLYITDNSVKLGFSQNRFVIVLRNGTEQSIPVENVEGISVFGNAQISTQCMKACLVRKISVQFYSVSGRYFGRLVSTGKTNTARQRMQTKLTEDKDFALHLAKNIMRAKIHNQIVLIRRYARSSKVEPQKWTDNMRSITDSLNGAENLEKARGYEGIAARIYFAALGELVNVPEFRFAKRSRRPPKDPFNAMLSLGYTMLLDEIYGALESCGLNPYFGFIHSDREKHPTLASDLMEEWRPVIVDSLVMSLVNGHEVAVGDFIQTNGRPGVFLDKKVLRLFIGKMEKKLMAAANYLACSDSPVTFRRAMHMQAHALCQAMEAKNPELYVPMTIR